MDHALGISQIRWHVKICFEGMFGRTSNEQFVFWLKSGSIQNIEDVFIEQKNKALHNYSISVHYLPRIVHILFLLVW